MRDTEPSAPVSDMSEWPTLQDAARILGVSEKTVRRLIDRGELGSAKRKQPGLAPQIVVVHPGDLARETAKRMPKPFVMPETQDGQMSLMQSTLSRASMAELIRCYVPPLGVRDKLFLTLDEAAEFSGLPKAVLLREVKGNLLLARKTGSGWRFRKADLLLLV